MAEVNLNINGKNYGIACDDGQEGRVIEVGQYVDSCAKDISGAGAASNENHLLVLTALVLADQIKELRDTMHAGGQVAPMEQAPGYQRLRPEEEKSIVQTIENLAGRIESVASKLAKAA